MGEWGVTHQCVWNVMGGAGGCASYGCYRQRWVGSRRAGLRHELTKAAIRILARYRRNQLFRFGVRGSKRRKPRDEASVVSKAALHD